jgi:hypothetical protein
MVAEALLPRIMALITRPRTAALQRGNELQSDR